MGPLDLTAPVELVAPALLGAVVSRAGVAVRLTEVEAYAGEGDAASHAARGRTPRTAAMYGPAGRWYVYFVYGMHWCANVVTGADGVASAVLLRAGAVEGGLALARERRPGRPDAQLARGPAALAAVLGLTGAATGEPVALTPGAAVAVTAGPRTGVREAAAIRWRFWTPGEPSVSPYRPAAPRRRAGGSTP